MTCALINPLANPCLAPLLLLAGAFAAPSGAAPPARAGACNRIVFEDARFLVCKADTRRHNIALRLSGASGKPLRNFAALQSSLKPGRDPLFAMNAGMFDVRGHPIGLYVERGKVRTRLNRHSADGNFYLKPNGVFALWPDGTVSVEPTARHALHRTTPDYATQSGPMLVIEGRLHPLFSNDGASQFIRNGVGVSDARTAWFVISEDPVSFGRFARLFRDRLHCPNALFLDGIVSSLWQPGSGRMDSRWALGPMFVVSERQR